MKNTENYQGNRSLIDQNIMINGDVLVDADSDINNKKFDSLYIDSGVSLGDKAKEVCLENKCFKYNKLNRVLNAQLPHFLYKDNETPKTITTTDDEISEGITPKKLCIGDYCITGEHLKILKDVKTSKLWAPNRDGAKLLEDTHPNVYKSEPRPYGTGYINGNILIRTHGQDKDPGYEGRWHDDNDDARVLDVISMATATGYPIGDNENDFQFSFLPGRKTNIKCFSIDNNNSTILGKCNEEVYNPDYNYHRYSSIWDGNAISTGHARGMLDSPQAWTSSHQNKSQWFQINSHDGMNVIGVVIQKRAYPYHNQYVKSIVVEYSLINKYKKGFKNDDFTRLNKFNIDYKNKKDSNEKVKIYFDEPIKCYAIRIYPQTWNRYISMRAGLLLCN